MALEDLALGPLDLQGDVAGNAEVAREVPLSIVERPGLRR